MIVDSDGPTIYFIYVYRRLFVGNWKSAANGVPAESELCLQNSQILSIMSEISANSLTNPANLANIDNLILQVRFQFWR